MEALGRDGQILSELFGLKHSLLVLFVLPPKGEAYSGNQKMVCIFT